MLICSTVSKERELIRHMVKEKAALYTDDRWEIRMADDAGHLDQELAKAEALDVVCVDITIRDGIRRVEKIRMNYAKAYIILIATADISPMTYIRPSIMASGLLLRPIGETGVAETVTAMIGELNQETDEDMFVLKDKDGKNRVAYSEILCFESREKKVYACTGTRDYGFYESLDHLLSILPDYFIRCHRAFIVNSRLIRRVVLSENALYLTDDYMVPLSRSYKSTIKEYINGN